ncbi:MAG: phage antirepressor KilAC domain-containing protein [Ginsengibacter sp.]
MNKIILKSAGPKMDFAIKEPVVQEEWYTMGQVAKLINFKKLGRTKLFNFLRDQKILMDNNEPYQRYIDSDYFKLVQKDIENGYGRIIARPFVTLVSTKGINFIKKQLDQSDGENGET